MLNRDGGALSVTAPAHVSVEARSDASATKTSWAPFSGSELAAGAEGVGVGRMTMHLALLIMEAKIQAVKTVAGRSGSEVL
jgi:hypothetical protein